MSGQYYWLAAILLAGMLLSIKARRLTTLAAITGGLLGWFIFMGAGFTGIAITAIFFLLGTWLLHLKKSIKKNQDYQKGTAANEIWARYLLMQALLLFAAWLARILEDVFVFRLMMAASLSSATADTLSSELGNVYGKGFYNILTLKKDTKGLDGVISFEGTIIGLPEVY